MDYFNCIFADGNESLSFLGLVILPIIIGALILLIMLIQNLKEKNTCTNCGEKFNTNDSFCGKCGNGRIQSKSGENKFADREGQAKMKAIEILVGWFLVFIIVMFFAQQLKQPKSIGNTPRSTSTQEKGTK